MDTTTEIVVALIVAIGGVIGAYLNNKKTKQETANREVQFALLAKQADDNKVRIEADLKLFHDFVHGHIEDHKMLDKKLELYHETNKTLTALTEQNKTLFANQEKTEAKVEKIDNKLDDIKNHLMKGSD